MNVMRSLAICAAMIGMAGPTLAEPTKITIATEGAFAPWNLTRADGTLDGMEIDLAQDLCKRMDAECTIISQNWDGIIPGLLAGKYDMIMAGMSATPKREEVVAFSEPYGSTGQTFAVEKGSDLAHLPDTWTLFSLAKDPEGAQKAIDVLRTKLKGKTIGVQTGSIGEKFVEQYLKDVVTVRAYKSTKEHDLDLKSGRIDIVIASPAYLMTAQKEPGNEDMVLTGPRFQGGVLGKGSSAAFRKEDTELRARFDAALAAAKADGTTKALSEKWFGFDVTVY